MATDPDHARSRGSARMRELGMVRVEVWLTPAEVQALVRRRSYREPLATILRRLACQWTGLPFRGRLLPPWSAGIRPAGPTLDQTDAERDDD